MPELPEVETVRRSLATICGRQIVGLKFSKLAPVETTTPKKITQALQGTMVAAIDRWGKYLLIRTADPRVAPDGGPPMTASSELVRERCRQRGWAGDRTRGILVIHLGMTGQMRFLPKDDRTRAALRLAHTHMEIHFADGSLLRYRDTRRFGTISLAQTDDGHDNPFLQRLGPDYLDPKLTDEIFVQRCRSHAGLNLKNLLLHQGVAAGLGNIYACEALYRACLNPKRKVARTKDTELIQLLRAAREILEIGIQHGGTTLRDYLDGLGNRGRMKEFLQVYDRKGLSTLDGRGSVRRIVQGGRSTWYCPAVQK